MKARYDVPWIAGKAIYGNSGLGVTGAVIRATTATGTHGPGILYDDWDNSGDDAKEFRARIVTPPSAGSLFVYEDGSFTLDGAADGSYSLVYRLFVDGVDLGTATETINVGSGTSTSLTVADGAHAHLADVVTLVAGPLLSVQDGAHGHSAESLALNQLVALAIQEAISAHRSDQVPLFDSTDTTVSPRYTLKSPTRRITMSSNTISNPGFSDKGPWERVPVGFNFGPDLREIGSALSTSPAPVVTITRQAGSDDATPEAMLDGAPWVSGTVVKQWIDDGVIGTRYVLQCKAYSVSGARLVMSGTMTVREK